MASQAATEVELILNAPSSSRFAAARFSVIRSKLLEDESAGLRRLFGSGKTGFASVIPLKKYPSHNASFSL
jgi:hypothetical protein